jgi:hypothetical protein
MNRCGTISVALLIMLTWDRRRRSYRNKLERGIMGRVFGALFDKISLVSVLIVEMGDATAETFSPLQISALPGLLAEDLGRRADERVSRSGILNR